jgi:hypothetical protein
MATNTPTSEALPASDWTRQNMLTDLGQQRMLWAGLGTAAVLFLLFRRREDEQEKAARHLVRDWRKVDDLDDAREHLQSNLTPLIRPVLLSLLGELETASHKWLRRVEREIKHL